MSVLGVPENLGILLQLAQKVVLEPSLPLAGFAGGS